MMSTPNLASPQLWFKVRSSPAPGYISASSGTRRKPAGRKRGAARPLTSHQRPAAADRALDMPSLADAIAFVCALLVYIALQYWARPLLGEVSPRSLYAAASDPIRMPRFCCACRASGCCCCRPRMAASMGPPARLAISDDAAFGRDDFVAFATQAGAARPLACWSRGSAAYTELGFTIVRTPDRLQSRLLDAVHDKKLETRAEDDDVQDGNRRSDIIRVPPSLLTRTLAGLQPLLRAWSGVALEPIVAYGPRVYHPGARLSMHTDQPGSHVLAAIVHIDHEPGARPWPLLIEGFDGETHEVLLEPGESLLYEAAKCLHGRPRPLRGGWFASIFVHFKPAAPGGWTTAWADLLKAIPPQALAEPGSREAEAAIEALVGAPMMTSYRAELASLPQVVTQARRRCGPPAAVMKMTTGGATTPPR